MTKTLIKLTDFEGNTKFQIVKIYWNTQYY